MTRFHTEGRENLSRTKRHVGDIRAKRKHAMMAVETIRR